jgi:hypothetical protein
MSKITAEDLKKLRFLVNHVKFPLQAGVEIKLFTVEYVRQN